MSTDSLEELTLRDYPARIEFDRDDGLFVVEFTDLPGCSATGGTVDEAYTRAQEAKAEWLKLALDRGLLIPEPTRAADYSGRVLLRLPSSLHAVLADRAGLQGASLNQYLVHLLSAATVNDEVKEKLARLEGRLTEMGWRVARLSAEVNGLTLQMMQKPTIATTMFTPTQHQYTGTTVNVSIGASSGLFTVVASGIPEVPEMYGQMLMPENVAAATSKLSIHERRK